jgi:phosphoribosylaminoimidazole-succinocarboxamide synthase
MSGINSTGKYGPAAIATMPLLHQGKTRDTFWAKWPSSSGRRPPRLIVASDRISTHNVVHKSVIPFKGEVLTALTVYWLTHVLDHVRVPHHLRAYGSDIFRFLSGKQGDYPNKLHHRAIVVLTLEMVAIEFIFRMYLTGSLWKDYYSKGLPNPYGIILPQGLPLMSMLHKNIGFDAPLFTPTEKSETDEPLDSAGVRKTHSGATHLTRQVFNLGRRVLNSVGLEGVDSKFEVGYDDDGILRVGDEVWTGDSSRIVALSDIKEGQDPKWRDKQLARDEAERIWAGGKKVPLEFSPEIIKQLSDTYLELFEQITGQSLANFQRQHLS